MERQGLHNSLTAFIHLTSRRWWLQTRVSGGKGAIRLLPWGRHSPGNTTVNQLGDGAGLASPCAIPEGSLGLMISPPEKSAPGESGWMNWPQWALESLHFPVPDIGPLVTLRGSQYPSRTGGQGYVCSAALFHCPHWADLGLQPFFSLLFTRCKPLTDCRWQPILIDTVGIFLAHSVTLGALPMPTSHTILSSCPQPSNSYLRIISHIK